MRTSPGSPGTLVGPWCARLAQTFCPVKHWVLGRVNAFPWGTRANKDLGAGLNAVKSSKIFSPCHVLFNMSTMTLETLPAGVGLQQRGGRGQTWPTKGGGAERVRLRDGQLRGTFPVLENRNGRHVLPEKKG